MCVAIATQFTMFWASMIHFVTDIKFFVPKSKEKKNQKVIINASPWHGQK